MRRTLYAYPSDVCVKALSHHAAKNAVEMMRREMREGSQLLKAQLFIKMVLNEDQHAQDAFFVVLQGRLSHTGEFTLDPCHAT